MKDLPTFLLDEVATTLARVGELAAAEVIWRSMAAKIEDQLKADPENTEWLRDLSVSHTKIGNVEVARGNGDAARAANGKGLEIAERLSQLDPENTQWLRDLVVSNVKLSEMEDQAIVRLQRALSIAQSMFERGKLKPADHWTVDEFQRSLKSLK